MAQKRRVVRGLDLVEERLFTLASEYPGVLGEACLATLAAGGKRVRPLLTLLCSRRGEPVGDPVLRAADYPRFGEFLEAVRAVSATELVDRRRLDRAVAECGPLYEHLQVLFERLSLQGALRGVPFDRRSAARALQLVVAT